MSYGGLKWLIGAIIAPVAGVIAVRVLPSWMITHVMMGLAVGLPVLGLLLLWRTGLISFGHALYFGLGAYSVAALNKLFGVTEMAAYLLVGALVPGVAAFLLGFVVRTYRGIYFAMLNLAFSMMFYGVIVKDQTFGSTDGFGIMSPKYFGFHPSTVSSGTSLLFALLLLVCYVSAWALHVYLRTTLGQLTTAIRDNEVRVEYLGYSVTRAIHIKFVLSAIVAGLGGVFAAVSLGQVDPDSMINWTISGEFVIIAVFSGAASVVAPFAGAVTFELIHMYAMEYVPLMWEGTIGVALMLAVLFAPNGIWTLVRRTWRAR